MLVQRSVKGAIGNNQANTAVYGFTLIVPAGWGMPFWQSLVFTGSLIAGLKERRNQHLEAGKPSFPEDYPHTQAGKAYWNTRAAQDQLRWLRKPASKRLNFTRLHGSDPWKPNWSQLLAAQEKRLYTVEEEEMNGSIPKQFETWLLSAWLAHPGEISSIASSTVPELALQQAVNRYREALSLNSLHAANASALYRSCIVRGLLSFDEGGSPKDMAFIFQFDEHLEDHVSRLYASCYTELTRLVSQDSMQGWIGYVVSGTQSLARGKGHGIGMVTLSGLLAKACRTPDGEVLRVLVGNRQGGPQRTATFQVIP